MTQRLASIVLALGLLSSCALGAEHRKQPAWFGELRSPSIRMDGL
jgi:hypothetical protein